MDKLNNRIRIRNLLLPFLLPAVVLLSLALDERFFEKIPPGIASAAMILSMWMAVVMFLWQEKRFLKKIVAFLVNEQNPEEYQRIIDHVSFNRLPHTDNYQKRILKAYLKLYQKDYEGAHKLASKEPFLGVPSFIRDLRDAILYETETEMKRSGQNNSKDSDISKLEKSIEENESISDEERES